MSVRLAEHWQRFPRKVAESPSLEILKSHLETALDKRLLVVLLEGRD